VRRYERPHIVWGWSGTLVDDVQSQVTALNAALESLGARPVALDTVRRHFATSASATCARILDRALTDRERTQARRAFEICYARSSPAQLVPNAVDLLQRTNRSGCTHSVLSLSPHNRLTQHIAHLGIASHLRRFDGRTEPSATSKSRPLAKHVAMLREVIGDRTLVLIGDSVDDVSAAFANHVHPVPHAPGLTHVDILSKSGVPVADSLAHAAALAVGHAHNL
jgi:phosphoglycolate phosphatase-like HAD superfamily hydrolase